MGACASVPKGMRAEAMAAPLPEQRTEEETTTIPEIVEVKDGDDNAKLKKEQKMAEQKGADNKHQSLGFLLNESEVAEESTKDEKSLDSKEPKGEEIPASDASVTADASS